MARTLAAMCSCRDCPSVEIIIVFAITALINIDVSISIPSLWAYTRQLGGDQVMYGVAASGSFVSAVIMLPVFGYLGDRYSPKKIFLVTFVVMAAGGICYAVAGSTPYPLSCLVIGRFVIGGTSGLRAIGNGFIATHSRPEQRTANLSIAGAVMNICQMAGPALNLLIVHLPRFSLVLPTDKTANSVTLEFDNLTWCGWSVSVLALLYVPLVGLLFRSPASLIAGQKNSAPAISSSLTTKKSPVAVGEMLAHVWSSRAWICAHCAYINNFTGNTLNFFLPVYAAREYGTN